MAKRRLDKDLKKIVHLERALQQTGRRAIALGLAALFLTAVWLFSAWITGGLADQTLLIAAAVVGGYMALNIGANDVANNMGPAVGARALTMAGALAIAAVFEAAGAILAGGDVVKTIAKDIVDPEAIAQTDLFVWAMISALLAAALWVNLATWIGAPVSTTHAIVGGVLGAGLAAAGTAAVQWGVMLAIVASWIISPALGGLIAALLFALVKKLILGQRDKLAAARRWVPLLVAAMAGVFTAYLLLKGLARVWRPGAAAIMGLCLAAFAAGWALVRPWVRRHSRGLENRGKAVAGLFVIPLIISAALLSFAHGANDVANAIGPLAAIVQASAGRTAMTEVSVPWWVMAIGAIGIAAGLALFGPFLIRMVGEKITKLDPIRAYCVALSAATTVLLASALGLPVSSTHIAVGAVFGVGFLREFQANRNGRAEERMAVAGLVQGETADERPLAQREAEALFRKAEKARKRRLVRRSHLLTIVAAWVITVPLAAILAGAICLALQSALGR